MAWGGAVASGESEKGLLSRAADPFDVGAGLDRVLCLGAAEETGVRVDFLWSTLSGSTPVRSSARPDVGGAMKLLNCDALMPMSEAELGDTPAAPITARVNRDSRCERSFARASSALTTGPLPAVRVFGLIAGFGVLGPGAGC